MGKYRDYKVEFSRGAQLRMAELGLDPADVEAKVRSEMERVADEANEDSEDGDELTHPNDFMANVVAVGDEPVETAERIWIVMGDCEEGDEASVYVMPGSFKEIEPAPHGNFAPGMPFHGKKIMVPTPDEEIQEH
jgi:hypothetical protein